MTPSKLSPEELVKQLEKRIEELEKRIGCSLCGRYDRCLGCTWKQSKVIGLKEALVLAKSVVAWKENVVRDVKAAYTAGDANVWVLKEDVLNILSDKGASGCLLVPDKPLATRQKSSEITDKELDDELKASCDNCHVYIGKVVCDCGCGHRFCCVDCGKEWHKKGKVKT